MNATTQWISVDDLTAEEGTPAVDYLSQNLDGTAPKTADRWMHGKRSITNMEFSANRLSGEKLTARIVAIDPEDDMRYIFVDSNGKRYVGVKNRPQGMCANEIEENVPEEFLADA